MRCLPSLPDQQVYPGSSATSSVFMSNPAYPQPRKLRSCIREIMESGKIGLPAFADWHFSFPFHPLSGDAIHNTWVIMFQTSLFTEVYPQELSGLPLMLCQAVYPLAIIAALCSAVLFLVSQCRKYISAKNNAVIQPPVKLSFSLPVIWPFY